MNNFQTIREKLGYTTKDVATSLEISEEEYIRYENCCDAMPAYLLHKLADLCNTNIDYLIGRYKNPKGIEVEYPAIKCPRCYGVMTKSPFGKYYKCRKCDTTQSIY